MWQSTPYTVPLLVAAGISVLSAFFAWKTVRVSGAGQASVLLLACAEWTTAYVLELASVDLVDKIFWSKLQYVGIVTIPTTFLIFALRYTGRSKWLSRRTLILFSLEPLATLLLVMTNEAHHLIWKTSVLETEGPFIALVNTYDWGFWGNALYSYSLVLTVASLLAQMLLRSRQVYGGQASALLVAGFIPLVGNALYVLRLTPFPGLDPTPLTFTATSLVLCWGISGLRLGDVMSISRRAAMESMSDGMIVVDGEARVLYLNPAALQFLGQAVSHPAGQRVEDLLPEWGVLADWSGSAAGAESREVVLSREDETRAYDLRRSPVLDWRGSVVSQVIVVRDITERKRLEEELAHRYEDAKQLADRDPVTGLLNHRAVHERLDHELKRAARNGQQLSIMIVDLDDFKLFNDTYGHPVGDKVLRVVAALLVESARGSDVFGRYGGDEFFAILPESGTDGATVVAKRIQAVLEEHPYVASDGAIVPIHLSCGIATYPQDGRLLQKLVGLADANMYESKQRGGNAITIGTESDRDVPAASGAFGVLDALVTTVDHKDHYTRQHSEDVTSCALWLARALNLSEESQRTLRIAGLLHDVGKIGVPDHILRKPGFLDEEENAVVKQHVVLGEMIVKDVPHMSDVVAAIGSHHERWDGNGYPRGLKDQDIPILGRILAVADAYSAMTTNRPYRKALDAQYARSELLRAAGSQLDPELVRVFLGALEKGTPGLLSLAQL